MVCFQSSKFTAGSILPYQQVHFGVKFLSTCGFTILSKKNFLVSKVKACPKKFVKSDADKRKIRAHKFKWYWNSWKLPMCDLGFLVITLLLPGFRALCGLFFDTVRCLLSRKYSFEPFKILWWLLLSSVDVLWFIRKIA